MKKIFQILCVSFICSSILINCTFFEGSKKNIKEDGFLYVRTGADFNEVLDSLSSKLENQESFKNYAESKDLPSLLKPGKYKLNEGETNKSLVNKLIIGNQEEVSLMIRNEPTIFHLAGSVSKKIEADSAQIVNAIVNWAKQKDPNLTAETVKMYFVPNTYNYYWATSGDKFVEKMIGEFDKVWNEERAQKAETMKFTPLQVFTLASIVQMEASKTDEQPKVAQAYLNRLAKNMRLEADPTSIYAFKLQNGFNQKIQRVYYGHLAVPSDYNTYRVKGLPPAPICLPNMTAVDAVLNPDGHEFVYFCADPDRPGYHSFTNDFAEHERNAAKYRKWLEERGIK
ncbi:endolytic transglycosylase MltG [Moheibacter lacus]|uniref:Endolytic murein transglycosylase n=1 Tax=Moheibacter lacus TaxID=2745851 RepID=A0A838ZJX8_9FLAO|nr:endolytic transglycosylase MltG [Moheibacter lacus]MBA5629548.1 endolytic transglycosylase MltG [Moheibacter lacus]